MSLGLFCPGPGPDVYDIIPGKELTKIKVSGLEYHTSYLKTYFTLDLPQFPGIIPAPSEQVVEEP